MALKELAFSKQVLFNRLRDQNPEIKDFAFKHSADFRSNLESGFFSQYTLYDPAFDAWLCPLKASS